MTPAVFVIGLVAGAAVLALWVDVRFPGLAPSGLAPRIAAAALSVCLLAAVPVEASVASLVGVLLPALGFMFLTALWLLRLLADARA